MNLQSLINKVRAYTRDFNGSIYRETDVLSFLYEGIDRIKSIPELDKLDYPVDKTIEISMIPKQYQYILSLYSASRCLFQDEQDYRAGVLMNEFESKMEEMIGRIADGSIIIKDADGNIVIPSYVEESVNDIYFVSSASDDDIFKNLIY